MRIVPIPCLSDNYACLLVCRETKEAAIVDVSEAGPVLGAIDHPATLVTARVLEGRSSGIKDLRHGLRPDPKTTHQIALRFIGSSLTDDVDHPLAEWLGDGLVTLGSATGHPLVGDVESTRLGGIAHMALTTDARVYACLQSWLKAIAAA